MQWAEDVIKNWHGQGLIFSLGPSVIQIYRLVCCKRILDTTCTKQQRGVNATDRIAAGLMDDDPVGEGLIMGLNVKCPLFSIERVFLAEVDVVHTCNLKKNKTQT